MEKLLGSELSANNYQVITMCWWWINNTIMSKLFHVEENILVIIELSLCYFIGFEISQPS